MDAQQIDLFGNEKAPTKYGLTAKEWGSLKRFCYYQANNNYKAGNKALFSYWQRIAKAAEQISEEITNFAAGEVW